MFENTIEQMPLVGVENNITPKEKMVNELRTARANAKAEKRRPNYARDSGGETMLRLNPKKDTTPTDSNGTKLLNGTTQDDIDFLTELTQYANGKGRVVIECITPSLMSHEESSKRGNVTKLEKHFYIQMQDNVYHEVDKEIKVLVATQVIKTIKSRFRAARKSMYIDWVQSPNEIKHLPYASPMPMYKPKKRKTKAEQLGMTEQELAQKRYAIKITELPPEKLNKLTAFLDSL